MWCDHPDAWNTSVANGCNQRERALDTPMEWVSFDMLSCCSISHPSGVADMMRHRDQITPETSCTPRSLEYSSQTVNEVILDTWDQPWQPVLGQIIEAVFVTSAALTLTDPSQRLGPVAIASAIRDALAMRIADFPPVLVYNLSGCDRHVFSTLEENIQ